MKKHYAMQWRIHGVDCNTGRRYADYYWFASRFERDAWVEAGAPYQGAGFREPVAGRDPELRRLYWRERERNEKGIWIEKH
jgi:hypothetical protein